jgi:hypothetical protein
MFSKQGMFLGTQGGITLTRSEAEELKYIIENEIKIVD